MTRDSAFRPPVVPVAPVAPVVPLVVLLLSPVLSAQRPAPLRPFADYEPTAAVVMSSQDGHGADALKRAIARHLPEGVTLVLYGHSDKPEDRARILEDYGRFRAAARLRYVVHPRAKRGFWSRDALPVPALDAGGGLVLADAKHWDGFEPDALFASVFDARLVAHRLRFEGGNLMANHLGRCYTVASRDTDKLRDDDFAAHYGCASVTRLPKRGGIGHIDERARFVDAATILTDTPEYASTFASHGLRVVSLPRAQGRYESYANALLVNGTAFVPVFGRETDDAAVAAYRDAGFTVVPLESRSLAARGKGLLHCLAMQYPVAPADRQ